ncbi:MAG: flagellar assembly protein FliW [Candidatus Margulisiibacteriota bacterium]|nr:MAG: hypothetical protein A2X43_07570 [Candidatus Margulisbacteria bacterium GWD2_39_127]OGI03919.1 MAG: hypothetical protein A2X42_10165 [Candidatus Margulisbacteria bacterium GWF2_38_17]OGI08189.1 MAG: hypothetical protein A2X41_00580 [Candidatus Margulisbacteria bacterium GWE2_39_32]PZM78609.1 MAG: flagellar assembly protein FliW [Candidatus Margulisiibacteriota bacterium]HAR61948.1 flagellar assembly protein FliW [Candidatus Margulisiibacteriota bacterium]
MDIITTRFGTLTINEQDIIHIEKGLMGFEKESNYILRPSGKNQLFGWLQSTENPALAFVVTNPFDFYVNYEFDLENEDLEELHISSVEDVYVLTILTIPANPQNISANLIAPIIINNKNKKGKQIILKSNKYQTKHFILKDFQNLAENTKKSLINQTAQ